MIHDSLIDVMTHEQVCFTSFPLLFDKKFPLTNQVLSTNSEITSSICIVNIILVYI